VSIWTIIAEALCSLGKNKIRTALSMLGIVIGVAAVITLVAMAQGTKARVEDEIAKLGDDWMFIGYWGVARRGVRKGEQERKPNQTKIEAKAIRDQCSAVRAVTPRNRMTMQIRSSYSNVSATVLGAWPCYQDIRRWSVDVGRLLDEVDEEQNRPVCVIGHTVQDELFGSVNPVGEFITIKNSRFEIVGLLTLKGRTGSRDQDNIIIFPYDVFQKKIAGSEVSGTILAAAHHGLDPKIAEEQIRGLLRQTHNLRDGEADDFRIHALSESAGRKEEASRQFEILLQVIAGISLIVGGIGIMNIMLVSVTERTREIGLRMAIGANEFDIMRQFLIEAVILCTLGGLLGMLVGWASTQLMQEQGYDTAVSFWVAGIALGCAFVTGVLAGFYPAWRASRFDPIEALRYE